ncbi:MAG TPA: hypothetical protein VGQ53_11025 [Chitinophagaceae bacterium]|jgi:hypothetical protein|nr:hypothetical protein [Chitinophagaceae bacterium]
MNHISSLVEKKIGYPNLLDDLGKKLSTSELNTLLMELFRMRAKKIRPAELLRQFEKNRFAAPSQVDTISFNEFELRCLKLAKHKGFSPITLSPLAPLGTCSAVAFVDQNNIVTALRGTEVVSDATNVFALLIAKELKKKKDLGVIKYAATHRHVRSQALSNPAFTPHFGIFCLATGGLDTGNFSFELEQLLDHITTHFSVYSNEFDLNRERLLLKIFLKEENEIFHQKLKDSMKTINDVANIQIEKQLNPGEYYKLVQFKFFIERNGQEINLSDGGFVDWTQKLIPNKKHRLIISGVGTELVYKMNRK